MSGAIFLSASVPDLDANPKHAATFDSIAIAAAVSALVYVTLGRRPLIWGGHPAITPMVLVVAEDFKIDYDDWVTLYQSLIFKDEFPRENEGVRNIVHTEVRGDREESLRHMRERMFRENKFDAAVFIGGMGGVLDEYDAFKRLQPSAKIVPVVSTGGAASDIAVRNGSTDTDLRHELDYIALFSRQLGIKADENRYNVQHAQPTDPRARLRNKGQRGPVVHQNQTDRVRNATESTLATGSVATADRPKAEPA